MSESDPGEEAALPDDGYRFYRGTIEKLFGGRRTGVVRSGNGREIPFEFAFVVMAGSVRHFEDLRVGLRIGFDVGWTEHGLRVTVIHVP